MEPSKLEGQTELVSDDPGEPLPVLGDVIDFEVPGRAEMLAYIRSRVAKFAGSMMFSGEEIQDIMLAVGEAGSNAVRHGCASENCSIGVHLERHPEYMRVRISDKGPGFDLSSVPTPAFGSLSEGGRGIMFMRILMDRVNFSFNNPGTSVDMVKCVRKQ